LQAHTAQIVFRPFARLNKRCGRRRGSGALQVSTRCTEYGICKFLQVTVAELLKILSAYIDR